MQCLCLNQLTGLLRLTSLAHWTTRHSFSLVQEQKLLAVGNQTSAIRFFPVLPVFLKLVLSIVYILLLQELESNIESQNNDQQSATIENFESMKLTEEVRVLIL